MHTEIHLPLSSCHPPRSTLAKTCLDQPVSQCFFCYVTICLHSPRPCNCVFFFLFPEDEMHHQTKMVLVTVWLPLWEFSMDLVMLPDLIIKGLASS